MVIETRDHSLVYDTGPGFDGGFNAGEAVLRPYLLYRDINSIDTLIVSHGDNDHAGGAKTLLEAMPVYSVYSGEPAALAADAEPCHNRQSW